MVSVRLNIAHSQLIHHGVNVRFPSDSAVRRLLQVAQALVQVQQRLADLLAEALGVPPTPQAVNAAITTGDPAVVQAQLTEAEAKMTAEVERHKADLADVADARATNLELAKAGSKISYAPAIVSAIVCSASCCCRLSP